MTNHVWQFSAARTRAALGWRRLIMLNDFTALAMAMRHLPPNELEQIGGGQPVPGAPLALLGPGTGLGVSGLIPAGEHWIPLQGEGGHVTLSVMNEREIAVLAAAAPALLARLGGARAVRARAGESLRALCALEGVVPEVLTPPEITRRAREGVVPHLSRGASACSARCSARWPAISC